MVIWRSQISGNILTGEWHWGVIVRDSFRKVAKSGIYGIGGFGTIEAIWTLVYVPLGMTLNDAIISGFSYHLIILLYTLFLGLTGILCLRWR